MGLQEIVHAKLDDAMANGYDEIVTWIASDIAIAFAEDCEGYSPDELVPHVESWIVSWKKRKVTEWAEDLIRPAGPGTKPIAGEPGSEALQEETRLGEDRSTEIDPVIAALLKRLPKAGAVWTEPERKLWLQLMEGSFRLIYEDEDTPQGKEE